MKNELKMSPQALAGVGYGWKAWATTNLWVIG